MFINKFIFFSKSNDPKFGKDLFLLKSKHNFDFHFLMYYILGVFRNQKTIE